MLTGDPFEFAKRIRLSLKIVCRTHAGHAIGERDHATVAAVAPSAVLGDLAWRDRPGPHARYCTAAAALGAPASFSDASADGRPLRRVHDVAASEN